MDAATFRERVDDLTVWKRGDQRAPHKPLLLLHALGRCQRGEPRLVEYEDLHPELEQLLREFGPPRDAYHPEYPFWRLENDELWELAGPNADEIRERSTDPSSRYLVEHATRGGLLPEVHELLASDGQLLGDVVSDLLEAHFPRSLHEDILAAVGLDLEGPSARRRPRDPDFRDRVLRVYEYRCGVCGFDVRLRDTLVALEAAHIKWHQAGGPDTERNGIALCSLHHKLFDRGAFTVSDGNRLFVSEEAHGSTGLEDWLLAYHEQQLEGPQSETYAPGEEYLDWHAREVFRGPARRT